MNDWKPADARTIFAGLVPDQVADAYQRLLDADGVPAKEAAAFFKDKTTAKALTDYGMATVYERTPGMPLVLDPVEPELAIAGLVSGLHAQIDGLLKKLLHATDQSVHAHGLRRTASQDSTDLAEVLTGHDEIIRASGSVINDAQRDFMDIDTDHRDLPRTDSARLEGPGLTRDRIRHRAIYSEAVIRSKKGREFIQTCLDAGQEIRWSRNVRLKMQIADGSRALVALTQTGLNGALLIRSPLLVGLFREYFERLWDTAHPVTDTIPSGSEDPVPSRLRPYIRLLAEGCTQEAMTGRLKVAPKTVQRRMREIRDNLGAESIFELGAAAHRRGWIP